MSRTEASNARNSCSFAFLYSSISFAASAWASLSFCTRSAGVVSMQHAADSVGKRTLAGLLHDLGGLFLGLEERLDAL